MGTETQRKGRTESQQERTVRCSVCMRADTGGNRDGGGVGGVGQRPKSVDGDTEGDKEKRKKHREPRRMQMEGRYEAETRETVREMQREQLDAEGADMG